DRLLSQIVHAEIDSRQLSETELLGIAHLLLLGALDTVTATLDCMLVYLATHPDRRQMLVDDPSRTTPAIAELLRWETPGSNVRPRHPPGRAPAARVGRLSA